MVLQKAWLKNTKMGDVTKRFDVSFSKKQICYDDVQRWVAEWENTLAGHKNGGCLPAACVLDSPLSWPVLSNCW
jgi:hypothetical protein